MENLVTMQNTGSEEYKYGHVDLLDVVLKDGTVLVVEAPSYSYINAGDIVDLGESKATVAGCVSWIEVGCDVYNMIYRMTGQQEKIQIKGVFKYKEIRWS